MLLGSQLARIHDELEALSEINSVKFTFRELEQIPKKDFPIAIIYDGSSVIDYTEPNQMQNLILTEEQQIDIYTIFEAKNDMSDVEIMTMRNDIDEAVISTLIQNNFGIIDNIEIDRELAMNEFLGFILNLERNYYGSRINIVLKNRKEK